MTVAPHTADNLVGAFFRLLNAKSKPTIKAVRDCVEAMLDLPDEGDESYGYGPAHMKKYVVARVRPLRTGRSWNNQSPEVIKARRQVNAGTHEMVTGRDGEWLILYSIPRRKVAPRPGYFPVGTPSGADAPLWGVAA